MTEQEKLDFNHKIMDDQADLLTKLVRDSPTLAGYIVIATTLSLGCKALFSINHKLAIIAERLDS